MSEYHPRVSLYMVLIPVQPHVRENKKKQTESSQTKNVFRSEGPVPHIQCNKHACICVVLHAEKIEILLLIHVVLV